MQTVLENDGNDLSMVVRGIEFRGSDFDCLSPSDMNDPSTRALFSFEEGFYVNRKGDTLSEEYRLLTDFIIDFEMPVAVVVDGEVKDAKLLVHLESQHESLGDTFLSLTLSLGQESFASSGYSGWFEDELLDLQKQLPGGTYIKTCINCAFSDYSPGGHGLFGNLACFRNNKEAYLSGKGKRHILQILPTRTEFVQETYLCPEFQRRVPGTGYRG